ncbi:ABC transporter substrate-binding protein [Haloarchaeobius iranensis]|uniref:Substrate-binding protein n=1 Tax=Haloarchaeobius iranensis TaxID=996166 RepID=A0A1G9TXI0_9EURY|nr:substrate-binding protein [Haloarchaeobius iranensis]
MARKLQRREVLKTTGIAGTAGLAGLAGCIGGGGGGGSSPDMITVVGYPEDGIQLFRDFYSSYGDDTDILIPDGLRDPDLPGQVGDDMSNITGTAPAAGGPAQSAYESLYQDVYGESPGVFSSQSYDSAAVGILANAAAGENSGTAIRDQMRNIANPDGMEVTPDNFVEGVEAAANGEPVNYQGASSSVNFDQNGDPASAAYALWEFDGDSTSTIRTENFAGANPEGSGPSADDMPGGMGREIMLGILLPETGALASTGESMINASRIPPQQVNESDIDLTVDTQLEDTETNSQSGVSAANSLVNAGYPYICGTASSGVNVPVCQEVLIPGEIVGCSPSSTALSVTNLDDNDYVFRTAPSDRLQGRVMAQVASEDLEAETCATLYINNDYGQQLSERFSSVFEDEFDGSVWRQVAFNQGESSYSSVVSDAMSAE